MGSDGAGDEPMAYPLTLLLMGFKCLFRCTLGVPRFMVPDTHPLRFKNSSTIKIYIVEILLQWCVEALRSSIIPPR